MNEPLDLSHQLNACHLDRHPVISLSGEKVSRK
jgi:hypothetical protein